MTTPIQRTYAVMRTREFLLSLLQEKETPGVPSDVRRTAAHCFRYYPETYHLRRAAIALPESWGEPE